MPSISQSSASRRGSPRSSSRGSAARQSSTLLVDPDDLAADHPVQERQRTPEHRPGAVARGLGAFADRLRRLCGSVWVDVAVDPCGLELERNVDPMRSQELGRPVEERRRRTDVLAVTRAPASRAESHGGALSEGGVGLSELCLVAGGLLEVVADDLVALDEGVAVLVEPGGEARVQVGRGPPWEGVVGGVADQQVAEAVAVVTR